MSNKQTSQSQEQAQGQVNFQIPITAMPYLGHRNNLNAKMYPKKYEENNQPSMTVPNQTMPLREILARYAKGQPLPSAGEPRYSDIDEIALAKLDISERHALQKAVNAQISEAKQKLASGTKKPKQGKETPPETPTEQSNE